ncbi:MAG: MFS transporter [Candidatus Izemoplasmatales bacterium]
MRLWNRNFTILTLGSFISALGAACAGIGFGFLVYQKTGSPLTLALFTVANIVPRMLTSFLAGPFVDRHSRAKIIYSLDFLSATCFTLVALILFLGFFDVVVFTLLAAFFGIIDTVYQLAFMSLFPDTIPDGQFARAYSISSLIWPVTAAVMTPIAAYMVDTYVHGIAILMAFNAATYLTAAIFETRMRIRETLNEKPVERFQFIHDAREGFRFYKTDRGLLGIGLLFMFFSIAWAGPDLLLMPYFMTHETFTLQHFSWLITASSIGRIVGGIVHYAFVYPPKRRLAIAVAVYFAIEAISASFLFMPYPVMVGMYFLSGLLAVTSFNIRMSATQAYLPAAMRGRLNAAQGLLMNVGTIVGCLAVGMVAEFSGIGYRTIIASVALVSVTAIFLFPIRMRASFRKIYNAVGREGAQA